MSKPVAIYDTYKGCFLKGVGGQGSIRGCKKGERGTKEKKEVQEETNGVKRGSEKKAEKENEEKEKGRP
jgi:hypothetical protein